MEDWPLALITLGGAMAHRETEEEWIHASEVLTRFPAEMKLWYGLCVCPFEIQLRKSRE